MSEPQQADLANWRTPPHSAWAFHHIDQILSVAPIAAGGEVWTLPGAPVAFDDFALPWMGATLSWDEVLAKTSTDGLVIIKDGQIVHEHYANGIGPHTPHILMSASKAVTGLLCGTLVTAGQLDPGKLVTDYLPELIGTAYAGATVRHLMDMRTGITLDEASTRAYEVASNWEPSRPGETPIGFHDFFKTLHGEHKPHGGPFSYISPNTDLLGWVIERATGEHVADLISERLWKPMGAEDGAYITVDRQGAPRCTGGICATVRDFARLGQLVLQAGRRGEDQIVAASWIENIAEGGDNAAWANGAWGQVFTFAGQSLRHRSGWYIIDDAPKTLFAMGIHGQNLFVDATNQLVIAKLSSQPIAFDYQTVILTHRLAAAIRDYLLRR